MNDEFRYSITGNPFVDTGQAVIACLAGKESFTQMSHNDVKKVFGSGNDIADWNSRLKSFTMVFGNNGPLYQPRGKKYETIRRKKYSFILSNLLSQIESPIQSSGLCECCGEFHVADLNEAYKQIDDNKGNNHVIGRDMFPLIGSLGSDAQALPSSSRMFNICPRCLFAVSFIPLGTRLLNGRLMVFERAHQPFVQDLIKSIVDDNERMLYAGGDSIEIIGKKQSTGETVKWLCVVFEKLQRHSKRNELPKNAELSIWLFSNAGTGASCDILQIPDNAVRFLWDAGKHGLLSEIASIASAEKKYIKNSDKHLLNSIRNKTDYVGLYPYQKYDGVSVDLFMYYQTCFLGVPYKVSVAAQKLARFILPDKQKEQKNWMKSDVFNDIKDRNILKRKITEMIEEGHLSVDDYFHLFPVESLNPLQVSFKGFKIITYFLHHLNEDLPNFDHNEPIEDENVKMDPRIKEAASLYFNDYVEKRGLKRFKKDVLEEFKNGNKNLFWIKNMMCDLSERHPGFGPNDWDEFWHDLCHDEYGNFVGQELLFQLRLAFSDLYRIKNQENIEVN